MKKQLLKGTPVLFLLTLIFMVSNSCKKDSDTPEDNPVNWSFSETVNYEITPGAVVSDPVSGFDFGFSDETATSTLKVSKIISGAEAPFAGNGYKIEYTGNEVLYVRIKCAAGNRVLGMMYAYPDGMFNGTLTQDWIGMPDMGTDFDSTEYYFSLPQPYDLGPLKADGKKRGTDLFWFSEIAKASTESGKTTAIGLQSYTFLHDYYIAALNPALKQSATSAYEVKLPSYAYGKENYYQAFWRPLGLLGGYIYHPTINFRFNANEPNAVDIAHETAHYFINLIVGNEVQKTLSGQAGFFDNHGFNEIVGRNNLVEELAYFAETATGYKINELSEPANSFGNNSRTTVDYPGIEGFGATMLYSLVRDKPTIQNVNYPSQRLDFPIIGLTYGQVFDIIAQGATNTDHIRTNIQEYLSLEGTGTQSERFPVVLQRIGWSYSVKGILVDSATNAPLEGYAIENIFKGGEGREYNDGQVPRPIDITNADGTFNLHHTVFPGSSFLRFSKDGKSFDKLITCPYDTPTSNVIELPIIKLNPNPATFAIGQNYGGGIIFYIDGTGQHGLISSTTDQGTAVWGCYDYANPIYLGANTGNGQTNTSIIVNGCPEPAIAARICDDLEWNGYSDWFLPSYGDLLMMYAHRNIIGGFDTTAGYWSSLEGNGWRAYYVYFGEGSYIETAVKSNLAQVRAIRAF